MGLDGVELILAIEDEFQIAITDEEAERSETPALLTDIVYSKLRHTESEECPSQHGFYKVRKFISRLLKIPTKKVKPDMPLTALIKIRERRKHWPLILSELSNGQTVFAPLQRPKWIKFLIYLVIPLFALSVLPGYTYNSYGFSVLITGLLIPLLMFVTIPMKYNFSDNYKYVKDLIKITGTLQARAWNRDEVYNKIKKMISEQLRIDEEKITPNSHFIKDLGLG